MKNLIKRSLLIVAVLTTIVTSAGNIAKNMEVKVIDSKLIDLKLKNSDGNLKISVLDSYGEVLYSEQFQGTVFSKKYDIKTLPSGNYYFEIEGQTKINTMPFTVTNDGVDFNNTIESTYYKPTVRQDGNIVCISKVALYKEGMEIALYDASLNTLYKEELTGDVNLGKTLNLKMLKSGNYKLVMKSDGKVFEQKIYKK